MCILASPVSDVSDTRILVGSTSDRQLIVYEMSVKLQGAQGGNAMILPVPLGTRPASDIHLIDFSAGKSVLKSLADLFADRSRSLSAEPTKGVSRGLDDFLTVQKVGNYMVSVAPTLADIARINPDVFRLSADTARVLAAHYSLGFGFVVAQLQASAAYHPLAYTHPLTGNALFVPTRHEHGGGDGMTAAWDHHIIHQGTFNKDMLRTGYHMGYQREVDWLTWAPVWSEMLRLRGTGVGEALQYLRVGVPLRCIRAQGPLRNVDLSLPLQSTAQIA